MEHSTPQPMNPEEDKKQETEDLDKLLSMRGKPFADWKEERKYLRDKWGMQGRQIEAEPSNQTQSNQEDSNT